MINSEEKKLPSVQFDFDFVSKEQRTDGVFQKTINPKFSTIFLMGPPNLP